MTPNQPQTSIQAIPLTILTGFLGAGKTTLLNRILRSDHGLRIAVLVNDFGSINIDSQLIVSIQEDTVTLSNGCICCTIRDDLLQAIEQLLQRSDVPEYILVETSGVSDPLEIALSFRYMPQVRIDSILTVIDADQVLALVKDYAVLAMNQIGTADILILNKVDLVDEAQLEAVRRYIRKISPQTRIFETRFAQVPLELILNQGRYALDHLPQRPLTEVHLHGAESHPHDHEHTDHSLIFNTWSWTSFEALSLKALQKMLSKLPLGIFRAKGVFYVAESPASRVVVHVVGKRVSLNFEGEAWGDAIPASQFVVIGTPDGVTPEALQQALDACLSRHHTPSGLERLTQTFLTWLRG